MEKCILILPFVKEFFDEPAAVHRWAPVGGLIYYFIPAQDRMSEVSHKLVSPPKGCSFFRVIDPGRGKNIPDGRFLFLFAR